jgi:asparagine synthetase B (glutamine-hydrolysing)
MVWEDVEFEEFKEEFEKVVRRKMWDIDTLRSDIENLESGRIYRMSIEEFIERYATEEMDPSSRETEKRIKRVLRKALKKRGKVKIEDGYVYVKIE